MISSSFSFRALSSASLLGLLVTLAGCSAESGTAAGADTTDTARAKSSVAAEAAADDRGARGPHHGGHGGPELLLFAALHEPINLTAEQKTAIEAALQANKPAAPPSFDKSRVTALAAGIRAGKVEASSVKAPNEDGMAARQAAASKALATLHATLTPVQRRALVDAVAKRGSEHGAKTNKEGGPPARAEGRPGAEGPAMGHMGHARGRGPGGMAGGMLEGLDLTKEQEATIKAKLDAQRPAPPSEADRAAMKAQHETMRKEMDAKLQTFANDTFDANAFVARPAGAPAMKGPSPADHFATELSIITSVLDAAQREKLAARIEAGPPAHGARQHMPGAPGANVQPRVDTQ